MSETNSRYLTELPYANLTDSEFKAVTASWNFDLSGRNVDLFDIVPNPDKFDERDPDAMLNSPCSQYFSFNKLNKSLNTLTIIVVKVFPYFIVTLEVCQQIYVF